MKEPTLNPKENSSDQDRNNRIVYNLPTNSAIALNGHVCDVELVCKYFGFN